MIKLSDTFSINPPQVGFTKFFYYAEPDCGYTLEEWEAYIDSQMEDADNEGTSSYLVGLDNLENDDDCCIHLGIDGKVYIIWLPKGKAEKLEKLLEIQEL
ncbi:MAG: hypothetical protein F6K22_03580 [Okeania sp. SIO2F4]|uniref:hypothetical protein n=1 Tax=Okeania sp. SIO2F4 TaxID=2607790 RepID=UPI00142A6C27|nr:hypothetical protein [Okeania sp. SIO2F4]NES01987.1 hypothetical protein [Okeania sp. SIO2F4]